MADEVKGKSLSAADAEKREAAKKGVEDRVSLEKRGERSVHAILDHLWPGRPDPTPEPEAEPEKDTEKS